MNNTDDSICRATRVTCRDETCDWHRTWCVQHSGFAPEACSGREHDYDRLPKGCSGIEVVGSPDPRIIARLALGLDRQSA